LAAYFSLILSRKQFPNRNTYRTLMFNEPYSHPNIFPTAFATMF
jgi:hypothetical protein